MSVFFFRYPPRSLQHSIITASKDSFSSIRNLCPIDVDSIATAARHIGSHLARAEVASRAMMALWSASLHLENSTYNHITPLESNEPSDVPPITETVRTGFPVYGCVIQLWMILY